MDIIEKIDEAVSKPSFEEFFLNKKNKRNLNKEFLSYYEEIAVERGQEFLDDDRYYSEEEQEEMEIDPVEAYENFAHADGFSVYYEAAELVIDNNKRKYNSNKNDKDDEDKQIALFEFLGYRASFR